MKGGGVKGSFLYLKKVTLTCFSVLLFTEAVLVFAVFFPVFWSNLLTIYLDTTTNSTLV